MAKNTIRKCSNVTIFAVDRNYVQELECYGHPSVLIALICTWLDLSRIKGNKAEEVQDLINATTKLLPFFDDSFKDLGEGGRFNSSLLLAQKERARQFPDIQNNISVAEPLKSIWNEWDNFIKKGKEDGKEGVLGEMPMEWDMCLRPIIAQCK